MEYSRPPPTTPGKRRNTMPGVRNSCSALAVVRRPDTVATTRNRTCQGTEGETWNKVEVTGAVGPKVGNFLEEEWIKASWKKGECREEIKLVADASGLGFDDARIVALRLYNHFHWLPQLRERSEKLCAIVRRERRLSLTIVRQQETLALQDVEGGETRRQRGGFDDEEACATLESVIGSKGGFNRYIRGLCTLCSDGTFEQILELLLRAYSTSRDNRMISRSEIAAILEKHVVYEDLEDPTAEKERVYRWFKRRFIQLTATPAATVATTQNGHGSEDASFAIEARGEESSDGTPFISWESARQMLRSGPHCLEHSFAIDLPCLSKDLWTADLVDVRKIVVVSSWQ